MNIFRLIIVFSIFYASNLFATTKPKYESLDSDNPITFKGDYIVYQGEKIVLGSKAFFIDGQFSDEEAAKYDYVYNSINEATGNLTDGTEESPMVLYIAPYVYWIDDPDDPQIRLPKKVGGTPIGLEINCEWLRFQGLTKDAENVVLASNRGQTMGAKGNFTMFKITGDGTSSENITFGNYCNVDLEFPLKPELNRKKRGSAIVQAQLAFCIGDKIFARNTHFISRLNLVPFYGGERTLFDHCHFESTDDALAPKGVYLNCTFEFYSSKPFGHTEGTGAVLLNCDINSLTRGEQYLVKGRGQIVAVDCRMDGELTTYWGWKAKPALESRNYHFNNKFNGKQVEIGSHHPYATVNMEDKDVLNAYRFYFDDKVIYNTYNLLRGNDDWNPMQIKNTVLKAEKEKGIVLSNLPTQLIITPTQRKIETGKDSLNLTSRINRFGGFEVKNEQVYWSVDPGNETQVELKVNDDGTCTVIPTNENDETKEIIVYATTKSGLKAASVIFVAPRFLDAPEFSSLPKIIKKASSQLLVDYDLNMKFEDQSLVTWYRCTDATGKNPIKVAVSRFNEPKKTYQLTKNDIGYYMMVSVAPNHLRCNPGEAEFFTMKKAITKEDVANDTKTYNVDLKSLSTNIQPKVIPGFWTIDCFKPDDTNEYQDWQADNSKDSWYYGIGVNGAANDTGLVQASKGARLRFTPVGKKFEDMKISFTACPAKTAGQGFSSAKAQYMDICIKFDTEKLNGYALRLFRTTKYHDAIDCVLMKYENGKATPITEPVTTSCYRTECNISIEVKVDRLIAHMETPAEYYIVPNRPEVKQKVDIEAKISPNEFGGIGFQHTGSVNSGATLIKNLKIEWN